MKKIALRGTSAVLATVLLISGAPLYPSYAEELDKVYVEQEGDRVVIGNDCLERSFSTAGGTVRTTEFRNKRTEETTVYSPSEGSGEFLIKMTKTGFSGLDKSGWTASADSYQNSWGEQDGPASNLLDGNIGTTWHTNYNWGTGDQEYPYSVLFDLNGEKAFRCFSYTPRQDGETNGNILGYELYASDAEEPLEADSEAWVKISEGELEYQGTETAYVNLEEEVKATQLKLTAVSAQNGLQYAGGAEFDLYSDLYNGMEFSSEDLTLQQNGIRTEDTEAIINGREKTGKKLTFAYEPYLYNGVEYTISENIVMYDGDHFMRKYLEISVPEEQKEEAVIDYIDLEVLNVSESDSVWTIPDNAGGIVELDQYKANLGQPFYIQGMFFGCEFPVADTQITGGNGYIRYYTGKSFGRMEQDAQAAAVDGKVIYQTWQTVAGAASGTETEVVRADFFDYIESIAQPSEFRLQYNSWFDNMMLINDEKISSSFTEIERELTDAEVRPLDSYTVDDGWVNYNDTYVLDSERAGNTLNESGFWEFNSKFPDGFTPAGDLAQKMGSSLGAWIGPRGGYRFQGTLADILTKSGKGSKAGGSVDVADRVYIEEYKKMVLDWQEKYRINYWKWDGFADQYQYNEFAATDGVPGYTNNHMTGGYQNMYHVSDLWEAWIDLFEDARENAHQNSIDDLWLSITCYVNPSPWYLQWANSVWLQCSLDQGDAGYSGSKMDRQMTYRDGTYYDFYVNHQFQFPASHLYNHDPVYGREETGMDINTATDEQFQNYLYMQAARGASLWELYFSDSIMTEEKYAVTAEFLEWAEENHHILKNSTMFGEAPNTGTSLQTTWNGENYAYGYSCFDGTEGIIAVRNPAASERTLAFTFDRLLGVPEETAEYQYHLEHSYNLSEGTERTGRLRYGEEYTFTLQPDEVRIFRISAEGDTKAPVFTRAFSDGDRTITVRFDEKVTGNQFTVEGAAAESVLRSADDISFYITLEQRPEDGQRITISADDIADLAGNALQEKEISFLYHEDNVTAGTGAEYISETAPILGVEDSLDTNYGFTAAAMVKTVSAGSVINQGSSYSLGIAEDGTAWFTLNGTTAVSQSVVNDGTVHTLAGVKENNGQIKLYVDGNLEGSSYAEENRYYKVNAETVTAGGEGFEGVLAVRLFDCALDAKDTADIAFYDEAENLALGKPVNAGWMDENISNEIAGNPARPVSMAADGQKDDAENNYAEFGADGQTASSYIQIDLEEEFEIEALKLYRYWMDGRTYNGTVISVSDTEDFAEETVVYNSDAENFHGFGEGTDPLYTETPAGKNIVPDQPVSGRYVRVYMHGVQGSVNTNHVVEVEVYGEKEDQPEEPADAADKTALNLVIAMAEKLEAQQAETGCYTEETWAAVQTALDAARALAENGEASQEDVDNAFLELITAVNLLENAVQRVALQTAIEGARAILADEEALQDYTPESVENLRNVLAEAEKVYAEVSADQETVNAASRSLMDAVTSLVVIDKDTRLDILIQKVEELLASADQYTSASVSALNAALEAAYPVADDRDASEEQINAAYSTLAEAMSSMVRKADKSELQTALDKAAEILADTSKYVEESVAGLQAAADAAQAVYDKEDADAAAVGEAVKSLVDEILKARLLGDVDGNGAVDSADSAEVLRAAAEAQTLDEMQSLAADVNGDGASDSSDAAEILVYAAEGSTGF